MQLEIPNFNQARIVVMGDVMLDRYWQGQVSRISPEAPVPVMHVQQSEERPGGAGNVALNIATLGSQVSLLGLRGDDAAGMTLLDKLQAAGVDCQLHAVAGMTTITKLRIISRHQQLLRLDFEEATPAIKQTALHTHYLNLLKATDLVVLSDYAKGCLYQVPELIASARQLGIPVLVDPKGNDFARYRGASLLTPNLKEFEAIVGACPDEISLVTKGLKLIEELEIDAILVTRGAQGMTLLRAGHAELHLPARCREVYDVTGAGDTVIAVLAASLASGIELPLATQLANIAAGITVSKLGAAAVSVPELRRELWQIQTSGRGIMTEEQLVIAIQDAKAHGERIVFTNGCFDILHAGHVAYLEQAKALGERLIVAVNSDQSVGKLKGPQRPINTLERRMAVLAGLNAVDWVVAFNDDTPRRLLQQLQPDILVKGGDYTLEGIVGHEIVHAYGGEVKVLGAIEDCSTTLIIQQARANDS